MTDETVFSWLGVLDVGLQGEEDARKELKSLTG